MVEIIETLHLWPPRKNYQWVRACVAARQGTNEYLRLVAGGFDLP